MKPKFSTLITLVLIVMAMGIGAFLVYDMLAGERHTTPATIIGKDYFPAYTDYHSVSCGDGCSTTIPVEVPEKFMLSFDADGTLFSIQVSNVTYHEAEVGQLMEVNYTIGKVSGRGYAARIVRERLE